MVKVNLRVFGEDEFREFTVDWCKVATSKSDQIRVRLSTGEVFTATGTVIVVADEPDKCTRCGNPTDEMNWRDSYDNPLCGSCHGATMVKPSDVGDNCRAESGTRAIATEDVDQFDMREPGDPNWR